jgi:hypothetical protein
VNLKQEETLQTQVGKHDLLCVRPSGEDSTEECGKPTSDSNSRDRQL